MIILFSRKIAFVRTQKTGSTSIENTMRKMLLSGDMATWDRFEGLENVNNPHNLNPHSRSRDALAKYGKAYSDCFSFAVERNPFDRVVSDYNWKRLAVLPDGTFPRFGICPKTSFEKFIEERMFTLNSGLYTIGGSSLSVDAVVAYENMQTRLKQIFSSAGEQFDLPQNKIKKSSIEKNYRSYYTSRLIDIVSSTDSVAVNLFGYSFDTKAPKNDVVGEKIKEKLSKIVKIS